jgi:hypothetical protein
VSAPKKEAAAPSTSLLARSDELTVDEVRKRSEVAPKPPGKTIGIKLPESIHERIEALIPDLGVKSKREVAAIAIARGLSLLENDRYARKYR